MSQERRIGKICEGLSATERARLVLEAYKANREPDPLIHRTTPEEQRGEISELVRQMISTNTHIAWLLTSWEARTRLLQMQKGWFLTLRVWGSLAYHASAYLAWHDAEPITESERDQRVATLRAETMSIPALAEYLLEREDDAGGILNAKQREIKVAIADGSLRTRKEGRATVVEMRSVYDWLGEDVPVLAEWGVEVQVMPDSQERDIRPKRKARDRLRRQLQRAPINYALHRSILDSKPTNQIEEIARQMERELRVGTERLWKELRAGEMVVNEVSRGFAGDDPLDPDLRFVITALLEQIQGITEDLEEFAAPVTLDEPDESLARDIRELVLRDFE